MINQDLLTNQTIELQTVNVLHNEEGTKSYADDDSTTGNPDGD